MNERIKELRKQAWKKAYDIDPDDPRIARAHKVMEEGMVKFAELIIQEFTKAIEAQKEQLCDDLQLWSEHDYGYEMAVNDSIEIVNKHFGIKQ